MEKHRYTNYGLDYYIYRWEGSLFLKVFLKILFIREGRREGEREEEKHQSVASQMCPTLDQTQACVLTRTQTSDSLPCGTMPNELSHTGQDGKAHLRQKSYCHRKGDYFDH